ncbi:cupin domain-containing protein [Jiulongibacter sp. NS-SX5]|uniref:cupin domain-containing protein n=1 Tax=Jiulongibacter sp. NS-SX5 TaxID=3463854 RepID=UPI0040596708
MNCGVKSFITVLLIFLSMVSNAQLAEVKSGVYKWDELEVRKFGQRESRRLMEGTSPHFDYLEIHATTQYPGAEPAPPHIQNDIEEVLIVKEGTMKMNMDDESLILPKGSVVLIPPGVNQSLQNVGDDNLSYYVMMFRSKKPMDMDRSNKAGGKLFMDRSKLTMQHTSKGGRVGYMDRPTVMCEKFEMHVTRLNHKGPSHKPHQHQDSEIILVTEGNTVLTIDGVSYEAKAGDLYFIKSGQMHGISNNSDAPCEYFAYRWY